MHAIVFGLAFMLLAIGYLVDGHVGPGIGFIVVAMLWFGRYAVRRRRARPEVSE